MTREVALKESRLKAIKESYRSSSVKTVTDKMIKLTERELQILKYGKKETTEM